MLEMFEFPCQVDTFWLSWYVVVLAHRKNLVDREEDLRPFKPSLSVLTERSLVDGVDISTGSDLAAGDPLNAVSY